MVTDVTGNVLYQDDGTPFPSFRFRRASSRASSVSNDEPEPIRIVGEATLCFEKNGTSFMGVIHSNDSDYSMHGKRVSNADIDEFSSESSSSAESSDDEETPPSKYDIRIKDHDDPTQHFLKGVSIRTGKDCKFKCPTVSFTSENSYKGHKALLVAQSCLGRGSNGGKLLVYSGKIDITVFDNRPRLRPWVL